MQKAIIIFILFCLDRISKLYFIGLVESGVEVNFYIFPFLNFILVWNFGIGFGLATMEANIFYHIITLIIIGVNLFLIYIFRKLNKVQSLLIAVILGGSLGNLFDRLYYFAVPDFIDFHIGNLHWFVFNVADIFITIGILGLILFEIYNIKKKIN